MESEETIIHEIINDKTIRTLTYEEFEKMFPENTKQNCEFSKIGMTRKDNTFYVEQNEL